MPRMALSVPMVVAQLPSSTSPSTMSFALFALTAGLALLFVALRQALRPHRKAVAVAVSVPSAETITAVPTSALAANIPAPAIRLIKRWGWAALDKLAALLEALEGDDEVPTPALLREKALQAQAAHQAQHGRRPSGGSRSTGGTWNLNGTSYRLPANTPPPNGSGKGTHKRTPSMHNNAPAPPNALLALSVPLSSPPVSPRNRGVFTPPPTMRQVQGMPVTGARPLSAARLIMSRHVVRKPYRSPPLPGQARTTPISKLAFAATSSASSEFSESS